MSSTSDQWTLADLFLVAEAVLWSVLFRVSLAVFRFPRTVKILEDVAASPVPPSPQEVQRIMRVINVLSVTRFFIIRRNCLLRSIVTYYFLRRAGVLDLELMIGVRKQDGAVQAHSWVTMNGVPVVKGDLGEGYDVIYSVEGR